MNKKVPLTDMACNTRTIDPLNKGLGWMTEPLTQDKAVQKGWDLLGDDLSLPAAVINLDKLQHNIHWMQRFADARGAKLAPHGKTTMAPKLFSMQIDAGAWGITLATAQQTQVAYAHGVHRVLMANQLVGRQNMEKIASFVRDPDFDYYCLIDSAENVRQLGEFFQMKQQRLQVLVELGMKDGRAGVRRPEQLHAVLEEIHRWKEHIALCGIEVYEGISNDETQVRAFLKQAVSVTEQVAKGKHFSRERPILSGAGSAWYDIVAQVFSNEKLVPEAEIVLRPGCYVTHDAGSYKAAQQRIDERDIVAKGMQPSLQPALQIWAYVHSVPEQTKAIIGLGKRDAAFDSGLPTPALYLPCGSRSPVHAPSHWKLTRMMDQHAYMEIAADDPLHVGDRIVFDISHPCLTFDKWRYLAIVDSEFRVVDMIETFF